MKKNRGFTIVELLVSFALISIIVVFLFQIILVLKDIYFENGIKTELLNKQSIMSDKINSKLSTNQVTSITKCGVYCLQFFYSNGNNDKLIIDKTNNTFAFGDYKTSLIEGSQFKDVRGQIEFQYTSKVGVNNTMIVISIPIENKIFKNENFGMEVVYQYNRYINNITNIFFDENPS